MTISSISSGDSTAASISSSAISEGTAYPYPIPANVAINIVPSVQTIRNDDVPSSISSNPSVTVAEANSGDSLKEADTRTFAGKHSIARANL